MYQTTLMCELVRQHGIGDKKKLYRLYAEAERTGKITRRSNDHNLKAELYALCLLSYLKSRQHRGYLQALKDFEAGRRKPLSPPEPDPTIHEMLLDVRNRLDVV